MTDKAKEKIDEELKLKTGTLDLSFCDLSEIPKIILEMDWLNSIFLDDNQITEIKGLEKLVNLNSISLYNNQITEIKGLEKLVNLNSIFLDDNQITEIKGLEKLVNLNSIFLGNNRITEIKDIDKLVNLSSLHLNNNKIEEIKGIDKLVNLSSLNLGGNQIIEIKGVDKLINLSSLYLYNNKITQIKDIDKLVNLNSLNLAYNRVEVIEGIETLIELNYLYLYNNQITEIKGIDNLIKLNYLYLQYNNITKITGVDQLINLKYLSLNNNEITEITGVFTLNKLSVLKLEHNPIHKLPTINISYLIDIPSLDLKGTKISDLSPLYSYINNGKTVLNWEKEIVRRGTTSEKDIYYEFSVKGTIYHVIRGINVRDCSQLDTSLIAAIQSGTKALLTYVNERRIRLFEARVLVLGEPRAGKTTLRRKLLDVNNPMPSTQESTKAFEIEVEPYTCTIVYEEKEEELSYYLWDFGGQDYYRLLHQLFVAEQSVYIIVVDTDRNKNEEEIGFWLDTIKRLGQDDQQNYGPVILLQNPKNKRNHESLLDLKKDYPFWQQNVDFIINLNALSEKETDSFDKKELKKFKDFEKYLSRSFCQLDHVGKEMPETWIKVRKALQNESENWISIKRFNVICEAENIDDDKQRIGLLDVFRRLGYLVHYKNSALKDMVILNREWITDALYRVLDDPIVAKNKGWFAKNDAEKIWYEDKYANRTNELLALMQEFKLCYQNPSTKKYIVPSKLPNSTADLPTWDSSNNVRLYIEYDWMPKAIGIQLLVALHEYIVSLESGRHWIWRKGAVIDGEQLELDEVQVRIREEYENKRIAIHAKGDHSEILVRVVMKKWKEVHEPFAGRVKVTRYIQCPCSHCINSDNPDRYKYQTVLKHKQKNETLKCRESFENLKAEDILRGVYDDTTVRIDSLSKEDREYGTALDLISSNELDKAIDLITSPKYQTLFTRRWNQLKSNSISGLLSAEHRNRERNSLANDLVDYFLETGFRNPMSLGRKHGLPPDNILDHKDLKDGQNVVQDIEHHEKHSEGKSDHETEPVSQDALPKESIYQKWWFARLLIAIVNGGILGYFANKYMNLHFGDTWLAASSIISIFLLMRNPKRVYLRSATYCILAIGGINILSQIDIAFNVTNSTEQTNPWDFFFKLGFGETPIVTIILGILAILLFVLDYKMRK